jgi:serine/threonine-protein kinase
MQLRHGSANPMTSSLGKYTLVRKLATGGMAEVFLARADGPMGFQKRLVVKRILPHFGEDQNFINMFLSEARLAAELNHPNVVQIFDFGEVDGQYFIAMELIDGPNLRTLNKAARETFGPLPLAICAKILALAAEGLGYAHDLRSSDGQLMNLVHRDISPDNVLVSRTGAVKVVDFGIAKASTQPHLTKSGVIKGKLAYMPPEQLAREPLDRRADIFALGIVLFELSCGSMPFDATSEVSVIQAIMNAEPLPRASSRRPDLPPAFDAIISKCLEKKPEQRYANCRELQLDLERFIASTGDVVSVTDIGKVVERLFPDDHEATLQNTFEPGSPLDKTFPSANSKERPQPAPAARSGTLAENSPAAPPARPVASTSTPLRIILPALLVVAAFGLAAAYWARPRPVAVETLEPPAVTPLPSVELDASVTAVAKAEPFDAGLKSGVVSVENVAALAVIDAGTKSTMALPKMGRIDFRIRPVGRVFLDGRFVGETPLGKEIAATVGPHQIKVVEPQSQKTLEKSFTVKSGSNVFTHNFNVE